MKTILIVLTLLLASCAQYEWVNADGSGGKINTLCKDYDLKALTSTSQSVAIDVTATPAGVKVKGETE